MVHDVNLSTHILHIFWRYKLPFGNWFTCKLQSSGFLSTMVSHPKLTLTQFSPQDVQVPQVFCMPLQHWGRCALASQNPRFRPVIVHRSTIFLPLLQSRILGFSLKGCRKLQQERPWGCVCWMCWLSLLLRFLATIVFVWPLLRVLGGWTDPAIDLQKDGNTSSYSMPLKQALLIHL